jgi:diacylglycerol kinase (ATP)
LSSKKNILFLLNPISGVGKKGDIPDLILNYLDELHKTEVRFTEYAGHGKEIAEAESTNYDAIIAIGGDGTVNEIGSSLVNTKCAMGIIPAGSGNGLARHLKIPLNIRSALERIGRFEPRSYDSGTVSGEFFVGTAGFGFDGYIAELFDQYDKRGFISYARLIAREYQSYEPKHFRIEINGESFDHKALVCAIANSSQFGNGFTISPESSMQDGKMEIILIDKFPLLDTAVIGARFFTQTIDNSRYFKSFPFQDKVKITVLEEDFKNYHLDGEPRTGENEYEIKIVPSSIKIL